MNNPALLQRYQRLHRTGQDCRLTNARNLLELYGHRYSYATVQGLSSSFFFTYRQQFSASERLTFPGGDLCSYYWPVAGHRMEALENLAYLFNATLVMREGQDSRQAQSSMLQYLREGIPVMVAVSRASIAGHLGQEHRFPAYLRDVKFGGHFVLVLGVDEASATAMVFDTDHQQMLCLPLAALAEARCQGDGDPSCLMQSHNRWAVFLPASAVPPLGQMMRTALTKVATTLRNADLEPGGQSGIHALRSFCREVPEWIERADLGADKLKATVFVMRLLSDKIAGGSLGRRAFGMFLRQAGDALRESGLIRAARHYAELTELWQHLMATLEERVFDAAGPRTLDTPALRGLLAQILEHEEHAYANLQEGLGIAP